MEGRYSVLLKRWIFLCDNIFFNIAELCVDGLYQIAVVGNPESFAVPSDGGQDGRSPVLEDPILLFWNALIFADFSE
jgi:hypothetical protein